MRVDQMPALEYDRLNASCGLWAARLGPCALGNHHDRGGRAAKASNTAPTSVGGDLGRGDSVFSPL